MTGEKHIWRLVSSKVSLYTAVECVSSSPLYPFHQVYVHAKSFQLIKMEMQKENGIYSTIKL